jgi:hypothetical protein
LYVLFFEIAEQMKVLRKETAKIEGLVRSVIPKSLLGRVLDQNRVLAYVAVLCVQIAEYRALAKKPDRTALGLFRDGVDHRVPEMPDVWHVKSVGISEYLFFAPSDDDPDATAMAKLLFNARVSKASQRERKLRSTSAHPPSPRSSWGL